MKTIESDHIKFQWELYHGKSHFLRCSRNSDDYGQNIITIEYDGENYSLYIWYDEGRFPACINTESDRHGHKRLKITGVDEL